MPRSKKGGKDGPQTEHLRKELDSFNTAFLVSSCVSGAKNYRLHGDGPLGLGKRPPPPFLGLLPRLVAKG